MRSNSEHDVTKQFGKPGELTSHVHELKKPLKLQISKLSRKVLGLNSSVEDFIESDADHFGNVRHVTTDAPGGFLQAKYNGNPRAHAKKLLKLKEVRNALLLRHIELRDSSVTEIPLLGYRVEFKQVVSYAPSQSKKSSRNSLKPRRKSLTVNGGFIHVHMSFDGAIYAFESTLRRGRKPSAKDLESILSSAEARKQAMKIHGAPTCERARTTLTLSAHAGRMDPVYKVTLSSCHPKKIVQYLVKAKNGKVLHGENKLRKVRLRKRADGTMVKVRCFLAIPDPNTPLDQQVVDHVISGLPDPTVLENKFFKPRIMKDGAWSPVRAKADGTFNYKPGDLEFAAVVAFVAMTFQMEVNTECGLPTNLDAILVYNHDESSADNAYYDPELNEIHILKGSGADNGGLIVFIEFDLGVEVHENGHHIVRETTPAKDLPGPQGASLHEKYGDMQAIVIDALMRIKYGKALGHEYTKQDFLNGEFLIGYLAAMGLNPPYIRKQRNTEKSGPNENNKEPHDGALVPGGACVDLMLALVAMDEYTLEEALKIFLKLELGSLALMPSHKVLYTDDLRGKITTDQRLFNSKHRKLIETAFAGHNIKLTKEDDVPTKRKPKPPKGKGRGKGKGKGKDRKSPKGKSGGSKHS